MAFNRSHGVCQAFVGAILLNQGHFTLAGEHAHRAETELAGSGDERRITVLDIHWKNELNRLARGPQLGPSRALSFGRITRESALDNVEPVGTVLPLLRRRTYLGEIIQLSAYDEISCRPFVGG